MKKLMLFLCSFVATMAIAVVVYFTKADIYQDLRDAWAGQSPEARQIASEKVIEFEKMHLSAVFGDSDAQYNLGRFYMKLDNHRKGVYWLRISVSHGNADAALELSRLSFLGAGGLPQSDSEAITWMKIAADKGSDRANGLMGLFYMGGIGVDQSFTTARAWLTKSNDPKAIEIALNLQNLEKAIDILPTAEKEKQRAANLEAARQDIRPMLKDMLEK